MKIVFNKRYRKSDRLRPETGKSLLINVIGKMTIMPGVNHARDTKNKIEGEPFESIREREEIKNILTELDKYAN
ncbi:MAG: hypothetical protein FWD23_06235 [Oscillospiraceae bacterium]|nr:hypothetical protein [Oscillospiraceae bacterium]